MSYETIRYETPSAGVARVVLDRDETRNAQNLQMTYELDEAFRRAAHDDDVKVVVLAADGKHFSSGHDLMDRGRLEDFPHTSYWGGHGKPGAEGHMAREHEIYLQMCWNWRNLPKPTIAEVQGKVIAGGLMLVWVCDLIVCSDDAEFNDPTVAFGVNGVEYFGHPWEFGVRKAKELLFTGDWLGAEDALTLGMVNRVVPRDELPAAVQEMADKIATKPSMGLKLAKQSVNQAQDAQGFWSAMQAAMSLQQLGHSNNQQVHGMLVDPTGLPPAMRPKREAKDAAG